MIHLRDTSIVVPSLRVEELLHIILDSLGNIIVANNALDVPLGPERDLLPTSATLTSRIDHLDGDEIAVFFLELGLGLREEVLEQLHVAEKHASQRDGRSR